MWCCTYTATTRSAMGKGIVCPTQFVWCLLFVLHFCVPTASEDVLIFRGKQGSIALETKIEAYGRDSLRVRIGQTIRDDIPGALVPVKSDGSHQHSVSVLNGNAISNGNLRCDINTVTGLLTFTRISDSKGLLQETMRTFTPLPSSDSFALNVSFSSDANEALYGLGEHKTGRLNNKGLSFDFKSCLEYPKSTGSEIMIPWVISSRGYGLLWNLPSYGGFVSSTATTAWSSVNTYQLDIWVTTSSANNTQRSAAADIVSNYADATGHAPHYPYFATGFWQSKNRYRSQKEILAVAQGYIQRGLPLSVIVIDWYHWPHLGDWQFIPACWPSPAAMTEELNKAGVNVMVSVWPLVDNTSINYQAMASKGYLVKCPPNNLCHQDSYLYDPTNPQARKFVFDAVQKGYISNGIKVFWLDAAEPELQTPYPPLIYSIGPDTAVGMMFPVYHQTTFYEGLKGLGEQDIIFLSRSAWAGSQKFGTAVWSGDVPSTFQSLQQQVRAGLNMGLSGIVWWGTDIGGYSGGNITNPQWRELVVRWFQWGLYCPIFRIHGDRIPSEKNDPTCGFAGGPNEVWEFGDDAFAAISVVMHIREQLRPYIADRMNEASINGTPVMRPLWFDFPNDPNAAQIDDQLMFGPSYMAAPVLTYQARSRNVYFPSGYNWVHWFTSQVYEGGKTVNNIAVPLNQFLLFLRVPIS